MFLARLRPFELPVRARRTMVWGLSASSAAVSALVWLTPVIWFGELLASFQFHIGLFVLAVSGSLALLRAPRLAAAAALIGVLHVAPDLALSMRSSAASASPSSPALRVLSANVLQPNRHFDEIAAALRASDADVIGVLELSGPMRAVLERELSAWPHRVVARPSKRFDDSRAYDKRVWTTALFSKLPLEDVRFVQVFDCYAPLIEARVRAPEPVTLRLAHLPRPGERWRVEARNQALEQLAREFEWGPQSVLMGDLNLTSGSPAFGRLLGATGLVDSRQGFGRCPSWWLRAAPGLRRAGAPGWLAALVDLRLGIAIDHVLHGAGLAVRTREVIELPFSDHGGVLTELSCFSEQP